MPDNFMAASICVRTVLLDMVELANTLKYLQGPEAETSLQLANLFIEHTSLVVAYRNPAFKDRPALDQERIVRRLRELETALVCLMSKFRGVGVNLEFGKNIVQFPLKGGAMTG